MGKLAFFSLQDETGTIQLFLSKPQIEAGMPAVADAFAHLKQLTDVGDIIGVNGTIERSEKGELSILVNEYVMLTKSLLPLPDKWHGLTDVAKRYRQRHAYADYEEMMCLTEGMITTVAQSVLGTLEISYQGTPISLTAPWRRVTMNEIVQEVTGLDFSTFDSIETAQAAVKAAEIGGCSDIETPRKLLNEVFEQKCETTLIQPTFVIDYPVEISPLAKPHRSIGDALMRLCQHSRRDRFPTIETRTSGFEC
jgi:lysyl-tRNA synthetase class II